MRLSQRFGLVFLTAVCAIVLVTSYKIYSDSKTVASVITAERAKRNSDALRTGCTFALWTFAGAQEGLGGVRDAYVNPPFLDSATPQSFWNNDRLHYIHTAREFVDKCRSHMPYDSTEKSIHLYGDALNVIFVSGAR